MNPNDCTCWRNKDHYKAPEQHAEDCPCRIPPPAEPPPPTKWERFLQRAGGEILGQAKFGCLLVLISGLSFLEGRRHASPANPYLEWYSQAITDQDALVRQLNRCRDFPHVGDDGIDWSPEIHRGHSTLSE